MMVKVGDPGIQAQEFLRSFSPAEALLTSQAKRTPIRTPARWIVLDHTGNSHTRAHTWLVLKLLQALPARRWKSLVADREFMGAEWFYSLRRQGIRRAIRIRKDTTLDEIRADEWFDDVQQGEFHVIAEKTQVFGEWMRVVATRSSAGDLVIIATDFGVWETWKLYKLRWSIECKFGSLKT